MRISRSRRRTVRRNRSPALPLGATSLSVTFLAPGRAGAVTARGRVLKHGRRFGYAEADVVNEAGDLLARATATFTILPERDQ